jgi:hypothetical protein
LDALRSASPDVFSDSPLGADPQGQVRAWFIASGPVLHSAVTVRERSSEEDAMAEQAEAGPAVNLSHDPFRLGVDAFGAVLVENPVVGVCCVRGVRQASALNGGGPVRPSPATPRSPLGGQSNGSPGANVPAIAVSR